MNVQLGVLADLPFRTQSRRRNPQSCLMESKNVFYAVVIRVNNAVHRNRRRGMITGAIGRAKRKVS